MPVPSGPCWGALPHSPFPWKSSRLFSLPLSFSPFSFGFPSPGEEEEQSKVFWGRHGGTCPLGSQRGDGVMNHILISTPQHHCTLLLLPHGPLCLSFPSGPMQYAQQTPPPKPKHRHQAVPMAGSRGDATSLPYDSLWEGGSCREEQGPAPGSGPRQRLWFSPQAWLTPRSPAAQPKPEAFFPTPG